MVSLLQAYGSTGNKASDDGDEPTPDAALLNAAIDAKIPVEPNKTYLIRILCVSNFPGHAFLFDQHEMTKSNASQNYAVWNTMDVNMLFFDEGKNPPPTYNPK